MSDGDMLTILEWDSRFFDRRIARVTVPALDQSKARILVDTCEKNAIDCLYFLPENTDAASCQAAVANGFRLVDVRVTLSCNPATVNYAALKRDSECGTAPLVRAARTDDIADLRAIARVSHTDSRFYQDPNFSRSHCDALYETWIEKSVLDPAEEVIVAEVNGKAAGYITCGITESKVGVIGLFAVAPTARERGLGKRLMEAALRWFVSAGCCCVHVVTQGSNTIAINLYRKVGFNTERKQNWYHYWNDSKP